jgi:hypothetical protein
MSRISEDWYNLPPLQKRIILSLAKRGPQTKNEARTNVKSEYKNIGFSFKSLQKKGLIHVVDKKFYRRQEFQRFWLTGIGVAFALLHEADANAISKHVKSSYPEAQEIRLTLSLTNVLGKKSLALALRTLTSYPLEEAIGKLSVIGLLEPRKYTSKNAETLITEVNRILRDYPNYHKGYVTAWRKIGDLSRIVQKESVEP